MFNGETKTVQQWAQDVGITWSAMMKRLNQWPIEKALSKEIYEVSDVSEEIKTEILDLHINEKISQTTLAKMYGVSQSAISKWYVKYKKDNKIT